MALCWIWGSQDEADIDPALRVSNLLEDINICLQVTDSSMVKEVFIRRFKGES